MSKIFNVRLPNAATQQYSPSQFDQLVRSLEQIILQLNSSYGAVSSEDKDEALAWYEGSGFIQGLQGSQTLYLPVGAFHDDTTQAAGAINTPTAVTFDSTDVEFGVYIDPVNTSRITVDYGGTYNFQFSAQIVKDSANQAYIWIWPRINGTDVPHSATKVSVQGSASDLVAAWNFVLPMDAGDYFELMYAVDDTDVELRARAAETFCPSIPSVILTVAYESSLTPV